ncbi:MAG: lipid-binding SYLF domain-containing protein [Acidisphaera sp.]|nr:lipid-binding SYLF domain-containing protein [Acidisphaera sp.]
MLRLLRLAALAAILAASAAMPRAQAQGADAQQLVNDAAGTVRQMRAAPEVRRSGVLRRARAIMVFPNLIRAGFLVGGEGGQGVLLAHAGRGWSDPAFYALGSLSVGAQAGVQDASVVLFIMTQRALNSFLNNNTFTLKAQADFAVVTISQASEAQLHNADVVVWTQAAGLYAGLTVDGTDIKQRLEYDQAYYRRPVSAAQIIYGRAYNRGAGVIRGSLGG